MFRKLVNTRYFSEAAIDFTNNGGRYTTAPMGSRDYKEYWDRQEERCANGYRVGDLWITGRHYFYLNFTPILKVPDAALIKVLAENRNKRGKIGPITMEKILEFPRFFEIDYEWYRYKHIAWNGGAFQDIWSPGAKHICCAKSRGAGFSYKESSDGVYNYTFIPESKSYYFAALDDYLTKDGILNKVEGMMDFINENIPEWRQNRMKKSTLMHQTATYIDDFGAVKGNKSQILGVIVDKPDKTRGKRGKKVVFEEAGSFKNLKKALAISIGSISDGGITVGQISVFGTGGEEGPSIEGLEEIYEQPDVYNMLAFNNIWEEGFEGTQCGYFVPATKSNILYMDLDGNVDMEGAIAYEQAQRALKEKAKDSKEIDRRKAEYPIYPSEVFQRMVRNPFDGIGCDRQIQRIERNAAIQALIRYGELFRPAADEGGGVQFHIKTKKQADPIEEYPHQQKGNLEGCWTIVERPWVDQLGKTPPDVYQIVFDPFYKEESEDLTSLFVCKVYKFYNNYTTTNEDLPVAWFVARPKDINRCFEQMFMGADWYNAMVQGEIAGGGSAVLSYAKTNRFLHRLNYEIEMTDQKEVQTKKNRSYLMNMPTEKKRMGLTYLVNWHKEQRGVSEDGQPIYNLHHIYDVGTLREYRKFNGKRNADRISADIIWQFMRREKVTRLMEQQRQHGESFYSRALFAADLPEEEDFIPQY